MKRGGIKYKDLNSFLASINVKFIQKLSLSSSSGNTFLPNLWIKNLFKIPTNPNDARELYFQNYFSNVVNILDCKFKVPRKIHYKGHPFYYQILKTYEKISEQKCIDAENILSTSIWFNRDLKSQFDIEISQAGFNFIKDLFPNYRQIEDYNNLRHNKIRKLQNLINKIPNNCKIKILNS